MKKAIAGMALCAMAWIPSAVAGRSCEERPLTERSLRQGLQAGERARAALDASGARAAVIARQGQDLSSRGLKYSHVGIVAKTGPGGAWRVIELLNACGSATSDLWSDGLGTFFLDDPFTLDFLVAIPPASQEDALARLANDPAKLRAIHTPRYSLASYPFATAYQNSNQWALEAIALSEASLGAAPWTRASAQSWLADQGYEPAELRVGALERLGGRMFKANVAFDDHPNALRFSDRIRVVSADSVASFLSRRGWRVVEVAEPPRRP